MRILFLQQHNTDVQNGFSVQQQCTPLYRATGAREGRINSRHFRSVPYYNRKKCARKKNRSRGHDRCLFMYFSQKTEINASTVGIKVHKCVVRFGGRTFVFV